MKMFRVLAVAALFGGLFTAPAAQASTLVWKDVVYGFTMSYPDTWTIQTQDIPSTRLRIAAPVSEDMVTCRMQVSEDGRLKIYPKRLMKTAVAESFDEKFWEGELQRSYPNGRIDAFYSPASLGSKGDATAVRFAFTQDMGEGVKVPMYGFMMISTYADKTYLASCSSKHEMFDRWTDLFMSIMDSVEMADRYHPFETGYYRDFLSDPQLALPRTKPGTAHLSQHFFFVDKYNR